MKYFFDTEFATEVRADGSTLIRPISIGIAAQDGRDYYAEFEGARVAAESQSWLRENVLPHLRAFTPNEIKIARLTGGLVPHREMWAAEIAAAIERFCRIQPSDYIADADAAAEAHAQGITKADVPEWVASYGGFDWVVLSSIWGGMMAMPEGWPYHFTEAQSLNLPRVDQVGAAHDALGDAQTLRAAWHLSRETK